MFKDRQHLHAVCMVRMLPRRPGSWACICSMLISWYRGSQASSRRFRYLWVSLASFIASVSCSEEKSSGALLYYKGHTCTLAAADAVAASFALQHS